jgi:hypothetical protein
MTEQQGRASRLLGGDSFSFTDAIGGWRGLIETALPGIVYVTVFLFTKTWLAPALAALGVVAVLVIVRLVQHGAITQSLSGIFGVAIGAIWAWRTGSATDFYGPGLLANIGFLVGVVVSMMVRWPVAGVVMGLVHGTGSAWREQPGAMRRAQFGSAVLAAMFALRLAVQVPLYLADQTAALGTAKLIMGTPLFALTLWVTWLIVRNVGRKPEPQDPPQQP